MPCHGQHFNQFHCVSSFNNRDFGSWVAMTNCCISMRTEHSACSAWSLTCAQLEPAFYPVFLLACLLNLILSFLVASFILFVVFRFFVLPFCLGPFCSECMRFYSILFPIVLLLLLVLGACLSFLFSLFTRARSHSWLILTFSSQQASAAFSLFDVFIEWRASHDHENTIASSATRIRPQGSGGKMQCNASSAKCK